MNNSLKIIQEDFNQWAYSGHNNFLLKLMKKNNMSESFARRSIAEYFKFIALAVEYEINVTPSKIIDEIWHAHILYTKRYKQLCEKLNGKDFFLHHNPEENFQEMAINHDNFKNVKKKYIEIFNTNPPADIWGAY